MLKNVIHVIIDNVGVILLSLISTIIVARSLEIDSYGTYSYALAVYGILATLGHAGLPSIAVRELSKSNDKAAVFTNIFVIKFTGYIIAFLAINIFAYLSSSQNLSYILFFLSISYLFRAFETWKYHFESTNENIVNTKVNIRSSLASSCYRIAIALSSVSYIALGLAQLIQMLILTFTYTLKSTKRYLFFNQISFNKIKDLLKESHLVLLGTIFAIIYIKIDQVMIKSFLGETEVAIYSISSNLTQYWYFFPNAVMTVFMPKLVEKYSKTRLVYYENIQILSSILVYVSILTAIIVGLFSEFIVTTLFGEKYIASAVILQVHIWSAVFIFLRVPFSKHIIITKIAKFSLITQGFGCAINIMLNYLLIPKYGIIGAAYATFFSYFTAGFLLLFFFKTTRNFFFLMLKSFDIRNSFKIRKIL